MHLVKVEKNNRLHTLLLPLLHVLWSEANFIEWFCRMLSSRCQGGFILMGRNRFTLSSVAMGERGGGAIRQLTRF